jgi:cytochrome c oxidase cbb3-type subunit 2
MNIGPLLFLGILLSTALSFWGLVIGPAFQIGRQELVGGYPTGRTGAAQRGAEVYRSLGCVECHTQQVRPRGYGTDIERSWGIRRTVAQDYLRDQPALIGNIRIGPDLANVGARQPDRRWHLLHLYDPQKLVPKSLMPPYKFLFEVRGAEVIPTDDAEALVAYLLSLQSQAPVLEAPLPQPVTNAVPADAGTNAPVATNAAASTNVPAK